MARRQTVYTNGERENTQHGPDGRLALERGRLWFIVFSSSNVDLAGGGCRGWLRGWQCPGQSLVERWLTSLGSPTLPLASLPGRKNSLVKIMVSFWLLTYEQGETNLATAKQRERPKMD